MRYVSCGAVAEGLVGIIRYLFLHIGGEACYLNAISIFIWSTEYPAQ